MNKKSLAICITTYKRPEILDDVLANIIPLAMEWDVPVYVNDNNSQDSTVEVLNKYSALYKYFYPQVNDVNIGFDKSFEDCLKRSKEDYIWGMADYSFIKESAISELIELINTSSADFIFLNNFDRVKVHVPEKLDSVEDVARNIGWHITLLDTIVWSRKVITEARFNRFYGSLFGYYGALFEYLCENKFSVAWISKSFVSFGHPKKRSLWLPKTFETWTFKLLNTVLSLPYQFSLSEKLALVKSHNSKSGLFSIKVLIILRIHGYLSFRTFWTYRKAIFISLPVMNFIMTIFVLLIPQWIANVIYRFGRFLIKR